MKYGPTILNVLTTIFLVGILINTVVNYEALNEGKGLGYFLMWVFAGILLLALLVDLALQHLISNRRILNLFELVIVIVVTLILYAEFS